LTVEIDVAKLRAKLGLSQEKFAIEFGLDVSTVRSWEQGKRRPDGPARVLLMVIARAPQAVQQALKAA
jgi:putative transcriptional regulator